MKKSTKCLKIGDTFDRLTITDIFMGKRLYKSEYKSALKVVCSCICGNTTTIYAIYFAREEIRSCGCLSYEAKIKRSPGHKDIDYAWFSYVKRSAKKRELDFNITMEYVWDVWESQGCKCALTGQQLKWPKNFERDGIAYRTGTASIDRIDSSKGYIMGNIQIVHANINFMKQAYSQEDFINMCRLVVEYTDYRG